MRRHSKKTTWGRGLDKTTSRRRGLLQRREGNAGLKKGIRTGAGWMRRIVVQKKVHIGKGKREISIESFQRKSHGRWQSFKSQSALIRKVCSDGRGSADPEASEQVLRAEKKGI